MELDDEILQEFLIESHENLDRMSQDLIDLEHHPEDTKLLESIFRTIHTIKGSCGFIGLPGLEALTHAGESLLVKLRDGSLVLNREIADTLLALLDAVRAMLTTIAASKGEGDQHYDGLRQQLLRLEQGQSAPAPSKDETSTPDEPRAEQAGAADAVMSNSTRVAVTTLDRMMNLLGELVLGQNQMMQSALLQQNDELYLREKRQGALISQLHEALLQTRMQPIQNLWKGLPRLVRDLSIECDKLVELKLVGGDTELDRTLLEALKDPLTHLLRNAIDHGIEPAAQRTQAGKSPTGQITLQARHLSGQIHISMQDDGAGIDAQKINSIAIQRGLITAEQGAELSDEASLKLIFQPGFSTAEKVSRVSGRGVGMDVVRRNIEKIGGVIQLQSEPGMGTDFTIRLPLTLAIMPGLVVRCGSHFFAIPQTNLTGLVQIHSSPDARGIEMVHGTPVYRRRNKLLPIVELSQLLAIESDGHDPHIVVLQLGDLEYGLVVDEIIDTQQIVVKPLDTRLRELGIYAGCTILGDGLVALILDAAGIALHARVIQQSSALPKAKRKEEGASACNERYLLTRSADGGQIAIPFDAVHRIEQIAADAIEIANGQEVVQLRGNVVPLVDITITPPERCNGWLKRDPRSMGGNPMQIIVCCDQGRHIGLISGEVHDIISGDYRERLQPGRSEMAFTAVIDDLVTEVVDVAAIIEMTHPVFFERML